MATSAETIDVAKRDWRRFYWDENNRDVKQAAFYVNYQGKADLDGKGVKTDCILVMIKVDAPQDVEQKIKDFKTSLPIVVERERKIIKALEQKPNTGKNDRIDF